MFNELGTNTSVNNNTYMTVYEQNKTSIYSYFHIVKRGSVSQKADQRLVGRYKTLEKCRVVS